MTKQSLLNQMASAVRFLSVDMIEQANSGHPGAPLGLADVATVLWSKFLRFSPAYPDCFNRDRFVLSGGHASAMLYSLLYLTGYPDITLDDLKHFRQLGSKTPGHPEKELLLGVDFSTGPLGQGFAGAVGMALAERILHNRFPDLVSHKTYVMCGDGDLMEGISEESLELAGLWQLNNLIVLWDDNKITIDGTTDLATKTNIPARFRASNWLVLDCDGHDYDSITSALTAAQNATQPVLIDCHTTIGFGAPTKANTPKSHGSPLGADEVKGLRRTLNWPYPPFDIPEVITDAWRAAGKRSDTDYTTWNKKLSAHPDKDLFHLFLSQQIPQPLTEKLSDYKRTLIADGQAVATRKASQNVLSLITPELPFLIGGSADLAAACYTKTSSSVDITAPDYAGNYVNYGIRELAMSAIINGLSAHGGLLSYGGTFMSFADYIKPTLRLGALMKLHEFFTLTHDSIGVGEDGPTHQPIEQLAMLRATPNIFVFRPADSVETTECYETVLTLHSPCILSLSRQSLPVVRTTSDSNLSQTGGYLIFDPQSPRRATLIATGSEVHLALKAKDILASQNIPVAVVSMPCTELFDRQPPEYQAAVLGTAPRIVIEAASPFGWDKYVQGNGTIIGINTFGASGKCADVMTHFGFTPEAIVQSVHSLLD